MQHTYYVYLLANRSNTVLYTGITSDLGRRLYAHRNRLFEGLTERYNVNKLVYFEQAADIESAIARETEIKGWRRERKHTLVESVNRAWHDLRDRSGPAPHTRSRDHGGRPVRDDKPCTA